MAIASTTAMLFLTGAAVAGQTASTIAQGRYGARAAAANAEQARLAAADAIARGEEGVLDTQLQTQQLIGAQRAGYATQGVTLGEGSPVDIAADTERLGALDAQRIRRNAMREAMGFRAQASSDSQQASMIRRGTAFGAANTLLQGAASATSIYQNRPRGPRTVPTRGSPGPRDDTY